MLTAAIASTEIESSGQLEACLLQTGMVTSVQQWTLPLEGQPSSDEPGPDVVLLDFSGPHDSSSQFAVVAQIRRLFPTAVVLACSPVQADPKLLLQAMRSGVQDFLLRPFSPAHLAETLARLIPERGSTEVGSRGQVIGVIGAKGGTGATTVAVNLGVQLAEVTKRRVILLDFGRPLGHVGLLLNLQARFSLWDATRRLSGPDAKSLSDSLIRHPSGLEVLPGASHPDEWQRLSIPELARLVALAQIMFKYVLIDSGPVYSSDWQPILSSASIVLVSEADVCGLASLERHLFSLAALGVPHEHLHVVINRWHQRDAQVLKSVEGKLKHPIFAKLPNDFQKVREAASAGSPLSEHHNTCLGARFRDLACRLAGISPTQETKRGAFAHLFSSGLALWRSPRAIVSQ